MDSKLFSTWSVGLIISATLLCPTDLSNRSSLSCSKYLESVLAHLLDLVLREMQQLLASCSSSSTSFLVSEMVSKAISTSTVKTIVVASVLDLSWRCSSGEGRRVECSSEAAKQDSSFGMFSNFQASWRVQGGLAGERFRELPFHGKYTMSC